MTWGPILNMGNTERTGLRVVVNDVARTRVKRPALVVGALVFTALVVGGCAERPPVVVKEERTCERKALPVGMVGVNVIDRDDASDDDSTNDGARGYGSDRARHALDRLRALGLDGVVLPIPIHARDRRATTVTRGQLLSDRGRTRLLRMIDDAHARGLVVVVVPHLTLDDGSWRGEMAPVTASQAPREAARAFMQSYGDVVTELAALVDTRCVEAFSAGVELKSLSRDAALAPDFDALVARVRGVFGGHVTYSANWDEVKDVVGWSRYDAIAVNAFAPLADAADVDDETLLAGARAFQTELFALAVREQKPVWMMEAGFKAAPASFVEPWKWPAEIAHEKPVRDDVTQARAYRALTTAARENTALGALFFWAVPSDPDDHTHASRFEPEWGFNFLGKEAEAVVKELVAR
jgi:hypothetical protein